ncbi:MAG: hypothetical protein COS89_03285, partial [Deltaproteobacteria bacterium CG07_land_8_20_14_0_80_38_7]
RIAADTTLGGRITAHEEAGIAEAHPEGNIPMSRIGNDAGERRQNWMQKQQQGQKQTQQKQELGQQLIQLWIRG